MHTITDPARPSWAEAERAVGLVVARAADARLTLGAAESLTGGLLSFLLARQPGSGEVFVGAITAYASDVKYTLLGVPRGPVVCESAARAMASGARLALGADVAVALTGVAGPEPQEGEPVGRVFGAVDARGEVTACDWHFGDHEPDDVRAAAAMAACAILGDAVAALAR